MAKIFDNHNAGSINISVETIGFENAIKKVRKLKYEIIELKKKGVSKRNINRLMKRILIDINKGE